MKINAYLVALKLERTLALTSTSLVDPFEVERLETPSFVLAFDLVPLLLVALLVSFRAAFGTGSAGTANTEDFIFPSGLVVPT